ncbi:HEPN/Toprim-associated domain-containing protein [Pantoea ananatis]
MGTEIRLDLSGMTVTYNKNGLGIDHGSLFQKEDIKRVKNDGIDYSAFAENEDPDDEIVLAAMEIALQRKLGTVKNRLELLGFTLKNIRDEFNFYVQDVHEDQGETTRFDTPIYSYKKDWMDFDEFLAFIKSINIDELQDEFTSHYSNEKWLEIVTGRFCDEAILKRIPFFSGHFNQSSSEIESFKELIGFLHPYSALRLMAENEKNADSLLTWDYGILVENGWASSDDIKPGASRSEKFLIATEGTSDIHILRHAFSLLMPDIEDFFTFIDVSERHPFSGASSLVKFAEGLVSIDVHNNIIFLLDNDAEGCEALEKIRKLNLPSNMSCLSLPDMDVFRKFKAEGPDGIRETDINGRAVAIECYLDLDIKGFSPPYIRWTNYKESLGKYQGALHMKEGYVKKFLQTKKIDISSGKYNVKKLDAVLKAIVAVSSEIAESEVRKWLFKKQ